jgi:alpha-D-ribose 1-methylphosphonate 5-triphosphate synthase subunit PhnH
MADFETSIWLDDHLARTVEIAAFLRFHTGARLVSDPAQATFAVISDVASMPALSAFGQGTADYPDQSTTLLIQVERLESSGHTFEGPGINGRIAFAAEPSPPDFCNQLGENRAAFPCGVDLIFVTLATVAALPRSVRLVKG